MVNVRICYREVNHIYLEVPEEIINGDNDELVEYLNQFVPCDGEFLCAFNEDNNDEEIVSHED
jgi:hypothetical protein